MDAESYEPTHPECRSTWERLNPQAKRERFEAALQRQEVIEAVTGRVRSGAESERGALKRVAQWANRSTYRKWKRKYEAHGFDGLLDWRMPPARERVSTEVQTVICTLRRMDANVNVEVIVTHVKEHCGVQISATSVKRILRGAGLSRRRGPVKGASGAGEQRLELGGMKLIEAAVEQTGYLRAMTEGLIVQRDTATQGESTGTGDTSDRDEFGRFLTSYNDRYRKGPEDVIGPGFASVQSKREGAEPQRFHIARASEKVVERKLMALLVSPLLGNGRWDGIRVPRGNLLGELCGFPYMPSTLELFTRELKYLGVSSTLWEIHARLWLDQTRHWGQESRATVVYVDETNKPLWTNLFSQPTAVSSVGRVMPGLDTVGFHTGYGVPLWFTTYSGRAPLVKMVPELLDRLERNLDGAQVGRIVVIDAEGNSVRFLKGLEQGTPARAWVTRLKPSMVKGKRIFNRTNFRPYRKGDRVRIGECDFNHPDGGTFRMRVVEVERRKKGNTTYLGASVLLREQDWKPQEIADLYFDRWPCQEANFRAVNQAVGLKDIHGYGKQLVENVSVVTRLDKLDKQIARLEERQENASQQKMCHALALAETRQELAERQRDFKSVERYVDERMAGGHRITPKLRTATQQRRTLSKDISRRAAKVERLERKQQENAAATNRIEADMNRCRDKRGELESRRTILKSDVELDSLFSLMKVGLVLLVTFVLKEYLGSARMDPVTFLERFATLPAKLRKTPDFEILSFEYNQRDPEVMALLAEQCEAINARRLLMRSGRILRIHVDPAPPPRRPPPKMQRVKPSDRFRGG